MAQQELCRLPSPGRGGKCEREGLAQASPSLSWRAFPMLRERSGMTGQGLKRARQLRLGVSNIGLDHRHHLRRDLADAMLLGMLAGVPDDFLFGLTAYDVLAATGWIDFGALENLRHVLPPAC